MLTKEEQIAKLKKGIESPSIPEHLKSVMRADLIKLESEETKPIGKKRGNPNLKKGEKNPYYLKKKEDALKIREFTAEEKEARKQEFINRRLKKKEKDN